MSRTVAEEPRRLGDLTLHVQPEWRSSYPKLLQGVTGKGPDFGSRDGIDAPAWDALAAASGLPSVARCSQVHGSVVLRPARATGSGVRTLGAGDALVTDRPDQLLAIGVADCVPVFLIEPRRGLLGLAHAGWRGIAAGVIEATLEALRDLGARLDRLQAHLGPAICGDCYEVGPEVPAALGLDEGRNHVDLRACAADRAAARGVPRQRITVSAHCTRCDGEFYSYRGGDATARMCAVLGGVFGGG